MSGIHTTYVAGLRIRDRQMENARRLWHFGHKRTSPAQRSLHNATQRRAEVAGLLAVVSFVGLALGCTPNDAVPLATRTTSADIESVALLNLPESALALNHHAKRLSHRVGGIIQGQVITHTFKFHNASTESLRAMVGELDCGCTQLKVPDNPIAPGAHWQANIALDTASLQGPFSQGGSIRLSSATGKTESYHIMLQGESQPPLMFSAPTVEITASSTPVAVQLKTAVPVDWAQADIRSSSKRVTATVTPETKNSARLELRGSAPRGIPKMHAEVVLSIPMQFGEDSTAKLRQFALPVYVKQEVDLAVFPQSLTLSTESSEFCVPLVLMGRQVSRELGIPRCTFEGYEVVPQLTKIENGGITPFARWKFTFRRLTAEPLATSAELQIAFRDHAPLIVPVHCFQQ